MNKFWLHQLGEMTNAYNISVGNPEGKRTLGKSRLFGRIILKWNLGKFAGWIHLSLDVDQ
jgi:hypothetical protein